LATTAFLLFFTIFVVLIIIQANISVVAGSSQDRDIRKMLLT